MVLSSFTVPLPCHHVILDEEKFFFQLTNDQNVCNLSKCKHVSKIFLVLYAEWKLNKYSIKTPTFYFPSVKIVIFIP